MLSLDRQFFEPKVTKEKFRDDEFVDDIEFEVTNRREREGKTHFALSRDITIIFFLFLPSRRRTQIRFFSRVLQKAMGRGG